MNTYRKRLIAAVIGLVAVVGLLHAENGAAWVENGEWQSSCGGGNHTCEVWDEWACESSPIFNENCSSGTTERRNVRKGWCDGFWCEVGM